MKEDHGRFHILDPLRLTGLENDGAFITEVFEELSHYDFTAIRLLETNSKNLGVPEFWIADHRGVTFSLAVHRPSEFLSINKGTLVAFAGRRSWEASEDLCDEVYAVNRRLIHEELPLMQGSVCYCSVLRPDGNYLNLVLFEKESDKLAWGGALHTYAALELSPQYYQWVLIYNGTWIKWAGSLESVLYINYQEPQSYQRFLLPD